MDDELIQAQGTIDAFVVDTDSKAEWALRKIAGIRSERDRLIKVCNEQIDEYEMKKDIYKKTAENEERYFIMQLKTYFDGVPHKETKTQAKYVLPSGSLILKQKPTQYDRSETLVDELAAKGLNDFIKVKQEPDWSSIKDRLQMVGNTANVITEDGEAIPLEGVTITPGIAVFEVKV